MLFNLKVREKGSFFKLENADMSSLYQLSAGTGGEVRVAKFESKVGYSRRTTKIGNLVVLDIFLVALILIPYDMRFVLTNLSSQNDICLLEKERVRIKTSKNLYGQLYFPKNIW